MYEQQIGIATMESDGTVVLQLRATGEGGIAGDARLAYPRSHPQYEKVLRHVGGLRPGQTKPVKAWTE